MKWGWVVGLAGLLAVGCSSGSSDGDGGSAGGTGGVGGCAEQCPGGCADDEYCAGDTCDAPGMCEPKPINCVDIYDPVCGCDGNTYGNGCEAELAGVRIDFEGQCPCTSNDDCIGNEYCAAEVGMCDTEGECMERPTMCPLIFMPVCGCDDNTYGNACDAAAAGVRIAAEGECL